MIYNGDVVTPPACVGNCQFPLVKEVFGTANRSWNYNVDGVAHIGLYPDIYQDLKNLGMTLDERAEFFGAADNFAREWDKIDAVKANVH